MINILKGILTAISLLVPGVSGGTMMIVLGVYDQTIEAISALISRKFIHIKLLIQLAIGGVIGLLLFTKAMLWSLDTYPDVMSFLFLGIIIAGLNAIIKKVEWNNFKIYQLLFLIIGIIIALVMTNEQSGSLFTFGGSLLQKMVMIVVAGIIIAIALILPGISTSFLLLTLGIYQDTLAAIDNKDISFLLPLMIGVVLGVIITTKLLEYLMKNQPNPTYLMILGFILGSIKEIFPGLPSTGSSWISCIISFVIGVVIMVVIQLIMKKYPNSEA